MKTDSFKGYAFALVATIAYSNVYIFSKAALNEVHISLFGLMWYAVSATMCLLLAANNKKLAQLKSLTKKQGMVLLTLGFLEIITTTLFFLSIHIIPDPAVTSFLGNMYPVFVTLGGVLLLKERFTWIEIGGVVLALAGAFVISYTGGTTLKTLFIKGTGIVLLNAIFATIATLVVKIHVKKLSPELLNLNRSTWLLVFSAVMVVVFNQEISYPASAVTNSLLGASLEFLAILFIYYSFKYIDVSRSSIVQSLKGLFVLIVAFLYFRTFLLPHQLVGGFLTIVGVMVMALAQSGIFRKKQPKQIV